MTDAASSRRRLLPRRGSHPRWNAVSATRGGLIHAASQLLIAALGHSRRISAAFESLESPARALVQLQFETDFGEARQRVIYRAALLAGDFPAGAHLVTADPRLAAAALCWPGARQHALLGLAWITTDEESGRPWVRAVETVFARGPTAWTVESHAGALALYEPGVLDSAALDRLSNGLDELRQALDRPASG